MGQSVEARAGKSTEDEESLSGVESDGATVQLCRLGIDAAGGPGRAPGATAESHLGVLGRSGGIDRAYPTRSDSKPEEAGKGSLGIEAQSDPALAGFDAGQELGLSRAARADR